MPWIIFLTALLLRAWGSGWGLPSEEHHWSYHPDEPSLYLYSRQVEPLKGDFVPNFYNYGTLYLTLLRITGDVAENFAGEAPEPYMLMGAASVAGRWISILAGAGTAVVVFLMLRRRVGEVGAIFGSLFIAFAPAHVIHSRFQTVDVLATFFLALSMHYALKLLPVTDDDRLIQEGRPAYLAATLSGLFAGLSAATKYTGILALATLFVCVFFARSVERSRLALAGLGTSIVAFLICMPGVLLNQAKFVQDFRYEMEHTAEGHGLVFAGLPPGFAWHVVNLLVGIGPLLVLMGLAGLAIACFKKRRDAIALAAFVLIYYLVIGRAGVMFLRYTFPLYIGLAFGFGWLIQAAWSRTGWLKAVPALGMIALGGLFGGGLATAAITGYWMSGPDPREAAADYFEEVSQPGTTVGLVADPWYYTPNFYYDTGAPRAIQWEYRDAAMRQLEVPKLLRFVPENPAERFDWDSRLLDLEPDYVVFTSFETEGLERLRTQKDLTPEQRLLVDRYVAFVERLKQEYDLVRTFGGTQERFAVQIHDIEYIRPHIWIWKRKAAG